MHRVRLEARVRTQSPVWLVDSRDKYSVSGKVCAWRESQHRATWRGRLLKLTDYIWYRRWWRRRRPPLLQPRQCMYIVVCIESSRMWSLTEAESGRQAGKQGTRQYCRYSANTIRTHCMAGDITIYIHKRVQAHTHTHTWHRRESSFSHHHHEHRHRTASASSSLSSLSRICKRQGLLRNNGQIWYSGWFQSGSTGGYIHRANVSST